LTRLWPGIMSLHIPASQVAVVKYDAQFRQRNCKCKKGEFFCCFLRKAFAVKSCYKCILQAWILGARGGTVLECESVVYNSSYDLAEKLSHLLKKSTCREFLLEL
jgi:hypothetical protein